MCFKKILTLILLSCLTTGSLAKIGFKEKQKQETKQKQERKEKIKKLFRLRLRCQENYKDELKQIFSSKKPEQILRDSRSFIFMLLSVNPNQTLSKKLKAEIVEAVFKECMKIYPSEKKACNEVAMMYRLLFETKTKKIIEIASSMPIFDQYFEETELDEERKRRRRKKDQTST